MSLFLTDYYANDDEDDDGNNRTDPDQLSCFDFIDTLDTAASSKGGADASMESNALAKYTFYPPETNVTTLSNDVDDGIVEEDDDQDDGQNEQTYYNEDSDGHPDKEATSPPPPPPEFDTNPIVTSSFTYKKFSPPRATEYVNETQASMMMAMNNSRQSTSSSSASPISSASSSERNRACATETPDNFILKSKGAAHQQAKVLNQLE